MVVNPSDSPDPTDPPGSVDAARYLASIIQNVPAADGYRYDEKDSAGNPMDTLKIIPRPGGGYLGIYHSPTARGFVVRLATSIDLIHWDFQTDLSTYASQPTIAQLSDGSFLTIWEANNPPGQPFKTWLQFRHYAALEDLLTAKSDLVFNAPHTLTPPDSGAEGTPNLYSADLSPDLAHSHIQVGFHYFKNFDVDRQARGTLDNFKNWTTQVDTRANQAVETYHVLGNIGGRDTFSFQGIDFDLLEGQFIKSDFGSWRSFLYNIETGTAEQLDIHTQKGSTAFANPKITFLPVPSGKPAVAVTLYLPTEGAASGEAGELVYYSYLATTSPTQRQLPRSAP